jgi:hypothetical protein
MMKDVLDYQLTLEKRGWKGTDKFPSLLESLQKEIDGEGNQLRKELLENILKAHLRAD